jgi:hypothetical protein
VVGVRVVGLAVGVFVGSNVGKTDGVDVVGVDVLGATVGIPVVGLVDGVDVLGIKLGDELGSRIMWRCRRQNASAGVSS